MEFESSKDAETISQVDGDWINKELSYCKVREEITNIPAT